LPELIVLFGRNDRAKELEILVLRHELSVLAVRSAERGSSRAIGCFLRR
jgi:hypothetical protein